MNLILRPLNLNDTAEVLTCWSIADADRAASDPDFEPTPQETRLGAFRAVTPGRRVVRWVAERSGRVVGWSELSEGDTDPIRAELRVHVAPQHRRRGIGSALLAEAEATSPRPVLSGFVSLEGGATGGLELARAAGYREDSREIERRLPWPPSQAATRRTTTPGYTVRVYVGELPADLIPAYCAFATAVDLEAPFGSATPPPREPDPDLYASRMMRMAELGLTRMFAVAVHEGSGAVAAISDLVYTAKGRLASTGFTRVAPAHRRHGLALATKRALYRRIVTDGLPLTCVTTYNNQANAAMIAVNEQLGFEIVREHVSVLKRRSWQRNGD